MFEAVSRKPDALRRILFLCDENYHASRFCEELFNSHARTEGLRWQATSRALLAEPATRNDGPMSVTAIEALRALGAAPVNHLRLPLRVSAFDLRTSSSIVVIGHAGSDELEALAGQALHVPERWPAPPSEERNSRAVLVRLARDLENLICSVQASPLFKPVPYPAGGMHGQGLAY